MLNGKDAVCEIQMLPLELQALLFPQPRLTENRDIGRNARLFDACDQMALFVERHYPQRLLLFRQQLETSKRMGRQNFAVYGEDSMFFKTAMLRFTVAGLTCF